MPRVVDASARARAGRKSHCEPFAEAIAGRISQGLSAQRIYQDLVEQHGFAGSYQSVKRYVARVCASSPTPVARIECEPGEEMQVDFGMGAPIQEETNSATKKIKSRGSWVFRAVLSYSRKGYSEAVLRQDTETFLRCLENAVRHFGGAPLLLNLDNLKAGVIKADWFDPEINPKLRDFCRHYDMHVMPCRPRAPEHKGKVERGVGYVKNNALKGLSFKSLALENAHLQRWETQVADTRIHGTTRQQVAALFALERPHLQKLPENLFPCYQEARRNVHRDGYVEVQRAFYQAPPELTGHQVWVRWDGRLVRIFNERMEQVSLHTRLEPGKFSRTLGVAGFGGPILGSCRHWVKRAEVIGVACGQWAQAAVDARGPEALRAIMALCQLLNRHSARSINAACAKATENGAVRFKDIRRLLGCNDEQAKFEFEQNHPLIRDLSDYANFIHKHYETNTSN